MPSTEFEIGVVKWFNEAKGYGFITPQSSPNKADVFVHFSVITGAGYKKLDEGQSVRYLAEPGPKGMQATRVDSLDVRESVEAIEEEAEIE